MKKSLSLLGLRGKILLVLIGMVAIFCIVITLVLNQRSNHFVEEQAILDIEKNLAAFELLVEEENNILSLTYRILAESNDLRNAVTSGNRYVIEEVLLPIYQTLNNEFEISVLQVVSPSLQGIYLAQEPRIHSVDLSERLLLQRVREQKTLQHGVDLGHRGLALRVAGPLYSENNRLLGYLELGRYLDNAYLDRLKENIGVDLTIFHGDTCIATTVLDREGNRAVGTKITHPQVLAQVLEKGGRWVGRLQIVSGDIFGAYQAILNPGGEVIGMLFAGTSASGYDARQAQDRLIAFGMLLAALLITACVSFLLTNKIAGPVTELSRVLEKVAEGDFTVETKDYGKDAVGLMGRAVAHLTTSLRRFFSEIVALSEQVDNLSESVANTAEGINNSIQDVAGSINEVASSAGELSNSSQEMNNQSDAVMVKAVSGEKAMKKALEQMSVIEHTFRDLKVIIDQLGRRSAEIGEIVQVINDISEQTNLLALNAAIEAARAGEYGRGFAVVADEVRKLAERSSASTEEIARLITATQQDTNRAVGGMDKSSAAVTAGTATLTGSAATFQEIVEAIQTLLGRIEEVASASQELSAGSEEVAAATEEQSAAVAQITAASNELQEAAANLRAELNKFRY
ncbi:MAG: methyl-accepting chemotaxis protein [Bacillota bacterium]